MLHSTQIDVICEPLQNLKRFHVDASIENYIDLKLWTTAEPIIAFVSACRPNMRILFKKSNFRTTTSSAFKSTKMPRLSSLHNAAKQSEVGVNDLNVSCRNLRNSLFERDPNFLDTRKLWNAYSGRYGHAAKFAWNRVNWITLDSRFYKRNELKIIRHMYRIETMCSPSSLLARCLHSLKFISLIACTWVY